AQRLVRTLCPACKKPFPIRDEQRELWNSLVVPWKANHPAAIHQPTGCLECRMTGYLGRVGLYEILLMSPEIRRLIKPQTEIAKVRDTAYREGMRPLRISGAMKVAAGLTSLDEIVKVAPPADDA
ncbi:MAG TPA: type II/IV secretion system protein, partial [Rhodocyclaceae bacterium]|nr:type II/IV secretion system protein [Rhodocyclaceae bacterium]